MDIGRLIASLGLDNQEFLRGIQEAERRMKTSAGQMAQAAQQVGDRWEAQGKRMQKLGKSMSLYLTTPLTLAGGLMLNTAVKFEKAMSQVAAVSGATGKELQALEDIAREMGATTKFSATEAAGALNFLAMAGFSVEDSMTALPATLNLAAAGAMDLAEAADIVSNVMQGFGIEAEHTGYVSDVLTEAFTNSNTSLHQLGEAMSYAAPVSKAFGISIEETTAAVGFLSDAGIQAGRAGTSLRQMLLQLSDKSGELGIDIRDANGRLLSMAEILEVVAEKGLTTDEMIEALGARAGPGFAVLMERGSDALREFTGQLEDAEGAAEDVAAVQKDNLAGALTILRSALSELSISFMQEFLPVLQRMTERIKGVIDWLAQLSDGKRRWIVIIGTALAALGPMLIVVGKLTSLIGAGIKAISTIRTAMTAWVGIKKAATAAQIIWNAAMAANPIGLMVTGLAAAISVLAIWNRSKRESTEIEKAHQRVMEETSREVASQGAEVDLLRRIVENGNIPLERRQEALRDLNRIVPEYNGKLSEEGELVEANSDALQTYIDRLRERLTMQAYEGELTGFIEKEIEATNKMMDAQLAYELAAEDAAEALEKLQAIWDEGGAAPPELIKAYKDAESAMSTHNAVIRDQKSAMLEAAQGIEEIQERLEAPMKLKIGEALKVAAQDTEAFKELIGDMTRDELARLKQELDIKENDVNWDVLLKGADASDELREQAEQLTEAWNVLKEALEVDEEEEVSGFGEKGIVTLKSLREEVAHYQQALEHAEVRSEEFYEIQENLADANERLREVLDDVNGSLGEHGRRAKEGAEELSNMERIAQAARQTMEGLDEAFRAIDLRAQIMVDYDNVDAAQDKLRMVERQLLGLLEMPDMDLVLRAGFEVDELVGMPDAELEALGIDLETRQAIQAVHDLQMEMEELEEYIRQGQIERAFNQIGESMADLGERAVAMQALGMEFNLAAEKVRLLEGDLLALKLEGKEGTEEWKKYRDELDAARRAVEFGEVVDLMRQDFDWMQRVAEDFSGELGDNLVGVADLFGDRMSELSGLFAEGVDMTDEGVQALIAQLNELGVEFDKIVEMSENLFNPAIQSMEETIESMGAFGEMLFGGLMEDANELQAEIARLTAEGAEENSEIIAELQRQLDDLMEGAGAWAQAMGQSANAIGTALGRLASDSEASTREILKDLLQEITAILMVQIMRSLPFPANLIGAAAAPGLAAGLFSAIGMKEGGVVPSGFDGDKYPAWLSSREVVIPPQKLEVFLQDMTQKVIREVSSDPNTQLPEVTQEIRPVVRELSGRMPDDVTQEINQIIRPVSEITQRLATQARGVVDLPEQAQGLSLDASLSGGLRRAVSQTDSGIPIETQRVFERFTEQIHTSVERALPMGDISNVAVPNIQEVSQMLQPPTVKPIPASSPSPVQQAPREMKARIEGAGQDLYVYLRETERQYQERF